MKIEINDFATLQTYQERFNIPFTASISRWAYKTFEGLLNEGEEEVELHFDPSILPKSYKRCPAMWAEHIKHWLKHPNIQGYKENGLVVLRVGQALKPTIFIQEVIATLQTKGKISFNLDDIPASYQYQPYVFIVQLRKRHKVNAKLRIIGNVITYYAIQTKTKLSDAGRDGRSRNKPGRNIHPGKSKTSDQPRQDNSVRPNSRPITSVIRRSGSLSNALGASNSD